VLAAVWIGAAVITSIQATVHHNNNFEIFRTAWLNLRAGTDLYQTSARHFDYFMYSPSFALFFAPFAVVPTWLGVLAWNALNAFVLYWAMGRVLPTREAFIARAVVFLDMVGSLQNVQSNALIAGLMILTFAELERGKGGEVRAAAAVSIATLIKIFPVAAAAFGVFHLRRLPRFTAASLVASTVLLLAPLLLVDTATLAAEYRSWGAIEQLQSENRGYSVMEHMRIWFGADWPNWTVQTAGVVLLLLPLVRWHAFRDARLRLRFVASVLMFCVLFNHKAESPSFVVALAGVGIWFALSERDARDWAVLVVVIVGTSLAASDAMPERLQKSLFEPYRLKVLPVLLVWLITQWQLWTRSPSAPAPAAPGVQAAPAT
jgi:hypothetical protein